MRRFREPDREFVPRNDIEVKICEQLRQLSGQEIEHLWTNVEYGKDHQDENGKPIVPGHDFVAETSTKRGDYYLGGNEYGIDVCNGEIDITHLGSWD